MLIDWNRENIKKKDSQRRFNYKFAAVKFFYTWHQDFLRY